MGKHKTPLKTKGMMPKGFSTNASGVSKQQLNSDFNAHLEEHSWADAIRVWKKLTLSETSNSGAAAKREELKSLIFEGRDYMESGQHNQAACCYCKALTIDPNNLDCLRNLAIIDLAADKAEQALELINRALAIRKDISSIWNVKIQCLGSLGRSTEAKELLDIAIDQHGLERKALLIDLVTRLSKPNPDESVRIARSLLKEYAGELDDGLFSLVGIARQYGCFELEDSINWWEESKNISPSVIPSVLLNLLAITGTEEESRSLALLQRKFHDWCLELCNSDPLKPLMVTRVSNRPIRIGVISGDFCNHVVARFLLPLLENLDPHQFEIFCFSTRPRVDDQTRERFEAIARFQNVDPNNPKQVAVDVRRLGLDLCIDAAGFTAYGATLAFSWRMAPLQLSMIGYPGSTFVPNMDLLLADPILKPAMDWTHSEDLFAMDGLAYCMERPDEVITVESEPPQALHGFVNFGILVNPYKYRSETISLWADVLRATPNSQMAIVRPECRSLEFQKNILSAFAENGIGAERIIIVNNHGRGISHLDCYNKIDVVLDSAPMTGGTSTYEALLMGLPVVTMNGPGYHQKLSATMLHHIGLQECVAESKKAYVSIASSLARDVNRLRLLRRNAKHLRTATGGLCDGKAYALRFKKALLKTMHERNMLGDDWAKHMEDLIRT